MTQLSHLIIACNTLILFYIWFFGLSHYDLGVRIHGSHGFGLHSVGLYRTLGTQAAIESNMLTITFSCLVIACICLVFGALSASSTFTNGGF